MSLKAAARGYPFRDALKLLREALLGVDRSGMIDSDAHSGSGGLNCPASSGAACGPQPPSAQPSGKSEQAAADAANQVVAAPAHPDPPVGAVFLGGSQLHACTGSVLHAAAGHLAPSVTHWPGGGGPATFVPRFAGRAAPCEVWTLNVLQLDRRWLAETRPLRPESTTTMPYPSIEPMRTHLRRFSTPRTLSGRHAREPVVPSF